MVAPLVRSLLAFAILYALFVCCWLWLHREALSYAVKNRDKKWIMGAGPPPPSAVRHGVACPMLGRAEGDRRASPLARGMAVVAVLPFASLGGVGGRCGSLAPRRLRSVGLAVK